MVMIYVRLSVPTKFKKTDRTSVLLLFTKNICRQPVFLNLSHNLCLIPTELCTACGLLPQRVDALTISHRPKRLRSSGSRNTVDRSVIQTGLLERGLAMLPRLDILTGLEVVLLDAAIR